MTAQSSASNATPDFASVRVEAEARLATLTPKLPASFRFDWRGIAVAGRLEAGVSDLVRLVADLGVVPFSAEDPQRREAALALHGHRQLRAVNNRLTLTMTEPLDGPRDMGGIVTAIALALIKARPAIDAAQPLISTYARAH